MPDNEPHEFKVSFDQAGAERMRQGRFAAQGRADQVITPTNLKQAYGVDIDVCYVEQAGRWVCIPQNWLGGHAYLKGRRQPATAAAPL